MLWCMREGNGGKDREKKKIIDGKRDIEGGKKKKKKKEKRKKKKM